MNTYLDYTHRCIYKQFENFTRELSLRVHLAFPGKLFLGLSRQINITHIDNMILYEMKRFIFNRIKRWKIKNSFLFINPLTTGVKSSVDYGDGTLFDQCGRLHNEIWLSFGNVESYKSQILWINFKLLRVVISNCEKILEILKNFWLFIFSILANFFVNK